MQNKNKLYRFVCYWNIFKPPRKASSMMFQKKMRNSSSFGPHSDYYRDRHRRRIRPSEIISSGFSSKFFNILYADTDKLRVQYLCIIFFENTDYSSVNRKDDVLRKLYSGFLILEMVFKKKNVVVIFLRFSIKRKGMNRTK